MTRVWMNTVVALKRVKAAFANAHQSCLPGQCPISPYQRHQRAYASCQSTPTSPPRGADDQQSSSLRLSKVQNYSLSHASAHTAQYRSTFARARKQTIGRRPYRTAHHGQPAHRCSVSLKLGDHNSLNNPSGVSHT